MKKNSRLLIVTLGLPIVLLVVFVNMARLVSSAPIQAGGDSPGRSVVQTPFTVTTIADSDGICDAGCSLREAIKAANGQPGADTITFALPDDATIVLGGTQLPIITDTLTINGRTAKNLTISGNSASRVLEIGSSATVTLTTLTIAEGNVNSTGSCPANCGGGIFNSGQLSIFNSTIISSVAYLGAGISNWGTATISHSTLNSNSASNGLGGGIYSNGPLSLTNSTLSANWALIGGGVFNESQLDMNNSTLNLNGATGGGGGGISNNGAGATLNFSNSIIANITFAGSLDCSNAAGTIGTNVNNLVADKTCSPTYFGDPKLGTLADNGGDTWTHALLPDSQAIDNGDDGSCEDDDQRGVLRPQESSCDIGSYEFEGAYDCSQAPLLVADTAELNAAIACYNAEAGGSHTISLATNVTLVSPTITISNTSGADLLVAGNGQLVDGANSYRLFTVDGGITIFEAITLTHGADNSSQCFSSSCGGGLMIRGGAAVTLSHSALISNTARRGAAIYNDEGSLNISFSTLSDNKAGAEGGGIMNAGTVTISNSTLSGNSAIDAGGIFNEGELTIANSTLSGNSAAAGGGILNVGRLTVSSSTFSGNASADVGGGILNAGTVTYSNSTLSGNSAAYGGAIYNDYDVVNVLNSTITNNRSVTSGAGIASRGDSATYTTISNTIVSGNIISSTGVPDDVVLVFEDSADSFSSGGHNLIGYIGAGIAAFPGTGDQTGVTDPKVGVLDDNGGDTYTHLLLTGSLALDAGDHGNCGATDQRGESRPQDGNGDGIPTCDIGAVEMPAVPQEEWFLYLPMVVK